MIHTYKKDDQSFYVQLMSFHKTVLHAWAILQTLFNFQFTQYYVLYADIVGNAFFITDSIHISVFFLDFKEIIKLFMFLFCI